MFARWSADTETKTSKFLVSQYLGNVGYTAVPASTAAAAYAEGAQRQVQIVVDYPQVGCRHRLAAEQLAYSVTAAVHINQRFEQSYLPAVPRTGPQQTAKLMMLNRDGCGPGQMVNKHKAIIVPR